MAKYANKNANKKKSPIMHKKPKIADYAKKFYLHFLAITTDEYRWEFCANKQGKLCKKMCRKKGQLCK